MFEGIIQPMHLLLILIVALLVFGPHKLPELGKGLGEAIRGFKKALEEDERRPVTAPQEKSSVSAASSSSDNSGKNLKDQHE